MELILEEYLSIRERIIFKTTLLVINDGSNDNTSSVIENYKANIPELIYICHDRNRGFGFTIKEVFSLPDSEWILFISGDNQFPIRNIIHLQKYTEEYDFIIGIRTNRKDNFRRRLQSKIYNLLIQKLFSRTNSDVNSIILTKRKWVQNNNYSSKSAFIHAEIFLKATERRINLIEVPIEHHPRKHGEGSGGKISVILPTIKELIIYKIKNSKYANY